MREMKNSFAQVSAMGVKRKLQSQVVQAQRRKARSLVTRAAQMGKVGAALERSLFRIEWMEYQQTTT